MSRDDTRAILADFQRRFSAMLRTPLARDTGSLRAEVDTYDERLAREVTSDAVSAHARLAVYNRQYWLRLFSALQHDFPLTARLVGFWTFNAYAADFLAKEPPRRHDLGDASEGFEPFLTRALDHALLREAVRIDAAHRRVLRAPAEPRLVLTASDAARLPQLRLTQSRAAALVEEHFALIALRKRLHDAGDERPVTWPGPLSEPAHWVIVRNEAGLLVLPLESGQARLYGLLAAHPVHEALARLEAATPLGARGALPGQVQRWLAAGVQHGHWVSAQDAPSGTTQL